MKSEKKKKEPKDPRIIDIEAILKEDIPNVICTEINKPNIDLFARAFYDIYIKNQK